MKRILLILLLFSSISFSQEWQFIATHVSPYVKININQINGLTGDTVHIVDTTFLSQVDTVFIHDSVFVTNYVFTHDTVTNIVYLKDTSDNSICEKLYNITTSQGGDSISVPGSGWHSYTIVPNDSIYNSNVQNYPSDNKNILYPKDEFKSDKISTALYPKIYVKAISNKNPFVRIIVRYHL